MLSAQELQKLVGAAANGDRLLVRASKTLESARAVAAADPDSAFVLAYDAARQALSALLAQQGLRVTTQGGHYALEQAVRAQFGPGFRQFGALRRRRNELEYPERPGDEATGQEAQAAVERAASLVYDAEVLFPELSLF